MKKQVRYLGFILGSMLIFSQLSSQEYPEFGDEQDVTILGLNFDAMEPFISPDGEILFFNSLNNGVNTKLYYAYRINDTLFNFEGQVIGANQVIEPHLDAVADIDVHGNFYWTSTRGYPANFDNLHRGVFNEGQVTNRGRVHGDFYIYEPGWLIMDHGITHDGEFLYFINARFGSCIGPCETRIGLAQKINDSTFFKTPQSETILQEINDPAYLYYAPYITQDDLELYYTRFSSEGVTPATKIEICVAVRDKNSDPFSIPKVLFSEFVANIVEAASLTVDKRIMYYHIKENGLFRIKMRQRNLTTAVLSVNADLHLDVYPNPASNKIFVNYRDKNINPTNYSIWDISGERISSSYLQTNHPLVLDITGYVPGNYLITIERDKAILYQGKFTVH